MNSVHSLQQPCLPLESLFDNTLLCPTSRRSNTRHNTHMHTQSMVSWIQERRSLSRHCTWTRATPASFACLKLEPTIFCYDCRSPVPAICSSWSTENVTIVRATKTTSETESFLFRLQQTTIIHDENTRYRIAIFDISFSTCRENDGDVPFLNIFVALVGSIHNDVFFTCSTSTSNLICHVHFL